MRCWGGCLCIGEDAVRGTFQDAQVTCLREYYAHGNNMPMEVTANPTYEFTDTRYVGVWVALGAVTLF